VHPRHPRHPRRPALAAALLGLALAALLGGWIATGWPEVRARQRAVRAAPTLAAAARAATLATDLRGQLEALLDRESARPYNPNPNPNPNPLVLGHFQLDDRGRVTIPTIDDSAPRPPASLHAVEQAFRDEVARMIAPTIAAGVPRAPRDPRTVTVGPFAWRTAPFAGAAALFAIRAVTTPDRGLLQGFVIDRTSLTAWLAPRVGDAVATLRAPGEPDPLTDDAADAPPTPAPSAETTPAPPADLLAGWRLAVTANPRARAAADRDATAIATRFALHLALATLAAAALMALALGVLARRGS
jgi:hypothetical protein